MHHPTNTMLTSNTKHSDRDSQLPRCCLLNLVGKHGQSTQGGGCKAGGGKLAHVVQRGKRLWLEYVLQDRTDQEHDQQTQHSKVTIHREGKN
jgi:hypothetical protein